MNIGNLLFLTVIFSLSVLALQRTIDGRRWLTLVFIVLPIAFFSYRWAIFREEVQAFQYAAGLALALNLLFWMLYGRSHPPGHKGDIIVLGMEDEE